MCTQPPSSVVYSPAPTGLSKVQGLSLVPRPCRFYGSAGAPSLLRLSLPASSTRYACPESQNCTASLTWQIGASLRGADLALADGASLQGSDFADLADEIVVQASRWCQPPGFFFFFSQTGLVACSFSYKLLVQFEVTLVPALLQKKYNTKRAPGLCCSLQRIVLCCAHVLFGTAVRPSAVCDLAAQDPSSPLSCFLRGPLGFRSWHLQRQRSSALFRPSAVCDSVAPVPCVPCVPCFVRCLLGTRSWHL